LVIGTFFTPLEKNADKCGTRRIYPYSTFQVLQPQIFRDQQPSPLLV
jgi:hypothetical protein